MTTNAVPQSPSAQSLDLLSRLLLQKDGTAVGPGSSADRSSAQLTGDLLNLTREDFDDLLELAHLNHVVVRGMEKFLTLIHPTGDATRAEWAGNALIAENARIANATAFLDDICTEFRNRGLEVCVIKSLDHWPDLGSDLDLYTSATPEQVCQVMQLRFGASIAARSWGDRLARKWNFAIPRLPELVETHVGRLGQTGEQVAIASSLLRRTRTINIGGRSFRTSHKSDRLLISTLQRMYRHFYFRLCDILDSASLIEHDGVDFEDLRDAATRAGIWLGTATYLQIVSDYVKTYRGTEIPLPDFVTQAARFGGDAVYYGKGFIRVPIMPQSARLYGSQLVGVLRKREIHNGARLSLLPWLATAAVVGQKITGSDKGIW